MTAENFVHFLEDTIISCSSKQPCRRKGSDFATLTRHETLASLLPNAFSCLARYEISTMHTYIYYNSFRKIDNAPEKTHDILLS